MNARIRTVLEPGLCLAAALLALTGCNQLVELDDGGAEGGGGGVPTDVQLAFERSCATGTACHAAGGIAPALEGGGIGGLIGAPSSAGIPLITIGDTANSYIAIKMLPDDVLGGLGVMRAGARMPLGFDYASGNEDVLADTRTILAWIGGADYPGGGGGTEETGDPTGESGSESGGPVEPTFANVDSIIFVGCSCHKAAPNDALNGGLSLEMGKAYANIFEKPSIDIPAMNLITPNDPANSYLYLKVAGGFMEAGGSGVLMPPGGMVPMDQLELLEAWINAGAPND